MNKIVFAPNLRTGGGLVLIKELMSNIVMNRIIFFIPKNVQISNESFLINSFPAGVVGRLLAEYRLFKFANKSDSVLCFNGAPPLFPLDSKVYIYLQNCLILESSDLSEYPIKTRLRMLLERYFLRSYWNRISGYYVQSTSMKKLLLDFANRNSLSIPNVRVLPFNQEISVQKVEGHGEKSFFYPADTQPHKNHKKLILAWEQYSRFDHNVKLHLTITKTEFEAVIGELGLDSNLFKSVECLGRLSHADVLRKLCHTEALIFPSKKESFGLPLLEARELGVPIIASELDYVRDICTPQETFDPNSDLSILRALERFSGISSPEQKVYSAGEFWDIFCDEIEQNDTA